jgi:hypothetical protein
MHTNKPLSYLKFKFKNLNILYLFILTINLFESYACRKQIFTDPAKSDPGSEATVYAAGYVFDGISNTAAY